MNWIARFFHEFRHPHCHHCIEERENKNHCNTCEVLATQNSRLIRENERLMDLLIDRGLPETTPVAPIEEHGITTHIPWNVRRQQLESEKRAEAIALKSAAQPDLDFGAK